MLVDRCCHVIVVIIVVSSLVIIIIVVIYIGRLRCSSCDLWLDDWSIDQVFSVHHIRTVYYTTARYLQQTRGLQQLSTTRARINVDEEVVHVTDDDAQQVKHRSRLEMVSSAQL